MGGDSTSDEENRKNQADSKPRDSRKTLAEEHKQQLRRLKDKDPEFYQFLQENERELLEFDAPGVEEDDTDAAEQEKLDDHHDDVEEKQSQRVITSAMVDTWCKFVREGKVSGVHGLMKAFRIACHYGDDSDESSTMLTVMSSTVFNKIMLFVLSEMDGVFRGMLKLPSSAVNKNDINVLKTTKKWKNYHLLLKSYFRHALHVLNQMTSPEMIAFTLRCLRRSSVLLAAFPVLLRRYIKVILHFWGDGGGALPISSFLFLRDICLHVGDECLDHCFKGIYKTYVLNCHFANAAKLQHIHFLGNCVIEILGINLSTAYQHAFVFIRQLATILRDAITVKNKESIRKIYGWKFMNCLELWTGAICVHGSGTEFRPLAYPLTQVIYGVARQVVKAQYFPLKLRCIRMLNRIAKSTATYIPISMLLLDILEMKELHTPPTGGIGQAIDLCSTLKVSKQTLKTRLFQEACVISVAEEIAEHLSQWSYSPAFMELSFIPLVRLRSFCKATKVERFGKEIKLLVRQIEANVGFVNERRKAIDFSPNSAKVASFLQEEKASGSSPLSQYVAMLRQKVHHRTQSMVQSSVVVGERFAALGDTIPDNDDTVGEKGETAFSTDWLPSGQPKHSASKKAKHLGNAALEEDVVEDLVFSSDEDAKPQNERHVLPRRSKTRVKKLKVKSSPALSSDLHGTAKRHGQSIGNPGPQQDKKSRYTRSNKRKRPIGPPSKMGNRLSR